ncbi:MAG: hypothetical protein MHM6MM_007520 [Cercozoa sp. M6MM]
MMHQEGGWPNEVDTADFQEKARFVRKIDADVSFKEVAKRLALICADVVQECNTIDLFEQYFADIDEKHTAAPPKVSSIAFFKDPARGDEKQGPRQICDFSWHPDGSARFAAAYGSKTFDPTEETHSAPTHRKLYESYLWDCNRLTEPLQKIVAEYSPLTSLQFNPKHSDTLAGGRRDGCVAVWDIRQGPEAIAQSLFNKSHEYPVTAVSWTQSRSGPEIVSTSTDGRILWWDTRNLTAGPIDEFELEKELAISKEEKQRRKRMEAKRKKALAQGIGLEEEKAAPFIKMPKGHVDLDVELFKTDDTYWPTCLDYVPAAGPMRYLVGSFQRTLLSLERKMQTKDEVTTYVKVVKSHFGNGFWKHTDYVRSLQRNPHSFKHILTCGDWSVRMWEEGLTEPLWSSPSYSCPIYDARWSPARPGVFMAARGDGTLDIWDWLYRQEAPVMPVKISDSPITRVSWHRSGKIGVAGTAAGNISVLEFNETLYEMRLNEKAVVASCFDREARRVKNGELRDARVRKETEVAEKKRAQAATIENQRVEEMQAAQEKWQQAASNSSSTVDTLLGEWLREVVSSTDKQIGDLRGQFEQLDTKLGEAGDKARDLITSPTSEPRQTQQHEGPH